MVASRPDLAQRRAPLYPRAVEPLLLRLAAALLTQAHQGYGRAILHVGGVRVQRGDQLVNPDGVIRAFTTYTRTLTAAEIIARLVRLGGQVDRQAQQELFRTLQRPALAPVGRAVADEAIQAWAEGAAERIVVILERDRTAVSELIARAHGEGWSRRRLGMELAQQQLASVNRSRLWARDQLGTVNAEITQSKQVRLGITHYRWRTSLDERVRERHAEREGKVFAWSDPPRENSIDGHPGHPINCRCTAEPIFPDELPGIPDSEFYRPA